MVNRGQLWSIVVNRGHLRSFVVNCGQLWSIVVNCGQLRSTAVNCGQLWSNDILSGLTSFSRDRLLGALKMISISYLTKTYSIESTNGQSTLLHRKTSGEGELS